MQKQFASDQKFMKALNELAFCGFLDSFLKGGHLLKIY